MNCYLCLIGQKKTTQPAFACCQRCGAGMCDQHMIEVVYPPVVGPGGTNTAIPRYKLMCCRCYHVEMPRPSTRKNQLSQPGNSAVKGWWRHVWSHRRPPLPEPTEAVTLVELFLKEERT